MDINYSRYGKVYFDYYTFSEDYPELCNLAKKVSSDINSYYDVAIIYGEMKNDNINSGTRYNDVCRRLDEKIENLFKSLSDYISEHRK